MLKGLEISEISFKEAINTDVTGRLDAGFFEKRFIKMRQQAVAWKTLAEHAKYVVCGPFGSTILNENYAEYGIPMIRPFNLRECQVDRGDVAYLSEQFIHQTGLKTFPSGTVMFARVGEIGAGVSFSHQATISPNIIAAELNDSINPLFVAIFSNTTYGEMQLQSGMKAVAQPTISTESIRSLRIPPLSQIFQKAIADIFQIAICNQKNSSINFKKAETTLLQALGLSNWQAPEPLSYIRSSRDAFAAGRLDAEHFQEKYFALRAILCSHPDGYMPLNELSYRFTNGAEIRSYQTEGTPYLRIGDLKDLTINRDSVVYVDPSAADEALEKVPLKTGDVLLSRSGSLAVSAVVEPEWEDALISSHLIRIRIADPFFDPYYIALFLKAIPGRMQIIQWSNGGVQPEISQPSLAQIVVPKLSTTIQQDIRKVILEAKEKRDRATQLLEAAKRAVEIAIEDSEQAALVYLEGQMQDVTVDTHQNQ